MPDDHPTDTVSLTPDTAVLAAASYSTTLAESGTWPLHPGPGFLGDPLHDTRLVRQLRLSVDGPAMRAVPIARGEALTRICDECIGVAGTHFAGCSHENH